MRRTIPSISLGVTVAVGLTLFSLLSNRYLDQSLLMWALISEFRSLPYVIGILTKSSGSPALASNRGLWD
ncbi:MAG: hypothetical protein ACR2PS_05160 [Pseudomonadales bacterium]